MGEFLYRLHFLAQLIWVMPLNLGFPFVYIVSGFVAFLFLFALITGLLVNWGKLVSNFFLFRPWAKLKTVWTDLHTVLGVIGFPYQFVFAFTGVVLIINSVFVAPYTPLLYDGNSAEIYQDLGYTIVADAAYLGKPLAETPDITSYISQTQENWPDAAINMVEIKN